MVRVGVLGLQGDVLEHVQMLEGIEGAEPVVVKRREDLEGVDALIIPGGESTTIGRLIELHGLREPIVELAERGVPVLGTCAGAVLLAKRARDREVGSVEQPLLALMDIAVLRNAFGRQRESFEATVELEGLGPVRAAFIRAPVIEEAWGRARIAARLRHPALGEVAVAAVQDNLVAVSFHTEVTGDDKLHRMLVDMAKGRSF
ncbi:MAG: pyridoxal 5'-phosphate synthase glutaminase subunit PdxT [Thermoproteota archaeon]